MIPEEDIIRDRLKAKSRMINNLCDQCGNTKDWCTCPKGGYDPEYD